MVTPLGKTCVLASSTPPVPGPVDSVLKNIVESFETKPWDESNVTSSSIVIAAKPLPEGGVIATLVESVYIDPNWPNVIASIDPGYAIVILFANILTFSGNRNEVCWVLGNTRPTIIHVPVGADKRDYFVEWTFENEGEVVYQELLRKLGKLDALEQEEEEMLPVEEKVEGLAIKKPKAKKKAKKK